MEAEQPSPSHEAVQSLYGYFCDRSQDRSARSGSHIRAMTQEAETLLGRAAALLPRSDARQARSMASSAPALPMAANETGGIATS
jgi:hypothetical protein